MEPEVIYVDNHLLVVNKPLGMLTQPDLEKWSAAWMNRPYAHAVHRLDRAASGIVVIAKTSKALSRLHASMRTLHFQKKYYAIVEGTLQPKEGKLEDLLVHDDYRARVVFQGGKQAILTYHELKILYPNNLKNWDLDCAKARGLINQKQEFLHQPKSHPSGCLDIDTKQPLSMLEVTLLTGRYHQIRVQFASRGHPILGDSKYGSSQFFSPLGIALHHHTITFPHPISQESLKLEAPFPVVWAIVNPN